MATTIAAPHPHLPTLPRVRAALPVMVVAGRILFSAIFIVSSFSHFTAQGVGYATQMGVPLARILVPASGLLALVGGLSVLLGYHARIGGLLLVAFLVPVTLWMHAFWTVKDPMMMAMQMANFMKNVSMAGAALLIAYFGPGPWSIDERARGEAE